MSEMVERVANILMDIGIDDPADQERISRRIVEAMRELPEEPGSRYTAGEYSRRNIEAMIDDALEKVDA